MNKVYEKVERCYKQLCAKTNFVPQMGLVLGSGLGHFAEKIHIVTTVDYKDIEGFPVSTVQGHSGQFVFGYIDEVAVVIMKGRVHYYEGYDVSDVVLPIRLIRRMGVECLILTNAAGGLNPEFGRGELMLITDQISSFVPSPLMGENVEAWGTRFPSMEEIYDKAISSLVRDAAGELEIPLQEGVYIQMQGPNYESPAEVRMCQIVGADAVGMSTGMEAIAAKHMGMRVCGISCISNMACGLSEGKLSHKEVGEVAEKVAPMFKELLEVSIKKIAAREWV